MFIEIIGAALVVFIILYYFPIYLKWSANYRQEAQFDDEKKNNWKYNLLAPQIMEESLKKINFLYLYYKTKYFS